jgi:cell division protein FtsB
LRCKESIMKILIAVLIALLLSVQYRLWIGEGSIAHRVELQRKIKHQQGENSALRQRNRILALEVDALKSGYDAIEERAREQMGMIKKGETFFMLIGPDEKMPTQNKNNNANANRNGQ